MTKSTETPTVEQGDKRGSLRSAVDTLVMPAAGKGICAKKDICSAFHRGCCPDTGDKWCFRMLPADRARKIVDAIIDDLSDRKGIKHEWNMIDDDVKDEIRQCWADIIMKA